MTKYIKREAFIGLETLDSIDITAPEYTGPKTRVEIETLRRLKKITEEEARAFREIFDRSMEKKEEEMP